MVLVSGARLASAGLVDSDGTFLRTPMGHRTTIPFGDHSSIDMDASTVALIRDAGDRRRVFLQDGQVRITVDHGVSKPTDVYLPHALLEDRGTQFNVSTHDDITIVTVTAGSVRVLEYGEDGTLSDPVNVTGPIPRRVPLTLSRGDSARLEEHGGVMFAYSERNSPEEAQLRSSWLLGEVATAGESLDEIVAQFNRYNRIPMVIEDPGIARKKLGGHYFLTETGTFLTTLSMGLGLRAVPVTDGTGDVVQMYLLRASDDKASEDGNTSHNRRRPVTKSSR